MKRKEMFDELFEYYRIDDKVKYEKLVIELNKYIDRVIEFNPKMEQLKNNEYIYRVAIENCDFFPTVSRLKSAVVEEIRKFKALP